jgi:hypothetical protein
MSYDYSVFVAPGPGPMSTWPPVAPAPLGTLEALRDRLSELYPGASWRHFAETWFGRSDAQGMEFQLAADADGACRFLIVRRIERLELEQLCRALGAVAVDNQKIELIRP